MEFILITLSSLLFTIPLYQPELFFLSWFAFIPLIYLTKDYDYSHSFISALLVGFLNSLLSFYWLYQVLTAALKMPFSFNLLILALYFLISALPLAIWLIINKFLQPKYSYSPFIAALSWSVLEFLRFKYLNLNPFNYFAYTQASFFSIARYASYGGIFLVSFIGVLIASYFVKIALKPSWKKLIPVILIFIILIISPFFLENTPVQETEKLELGVLDFKLNSSENHFDTLETEINIFTDLIAETEAEYLFTPEQILSFDLLRNAYYREKFYSKLTETMAGKYLQFGSYAAAENYNSKAYNSLFLLNSKLEILARYNKQKNLVNTVNLANKNEIFTYLSQYLNFNYNKLAKAKKINVFKTNKFSYLNLMADEIFIPLAAINYQYSSNYNLIVNSALENDLSSEVYNNFSLAAAVFRAAEAGRPVLRTVSGGYSAYINHQGDIIWQDKLVNESKMFLVKLKNKNSYYQKYPNKIILILSSILFIIFMMKIIFIIKNKLSSRN